AAQVTHPPRPVALVAHGRIDPDLLQLHGLRRPCGGLGLEQDRLSVEPDPRPPLADLRLRPPAESLPVAAERIDADLLEVRLRAGRDEQVEIARGRVAQPGLAG